MPDPNLASMAKIARHDDVYPPADDSFLLVDALSSLWDTSLRARKPSLCVEIGTGSGYVACSNAMLARGHGCAEITTTRASDVNARAVETCAATLRAHGVDARACAVARGDLLEPHRDAIEARGGIDVLLFNPPYVVTPSEEVGRDGIASAWAGGVDGREVLDRLLPDVRDALAPGGIFLCVIIEQNKPREIMAMMEAMGLRSAIVSECRADEERLYVMRCDKPR